MAIKLNSSISLGTIAWGKQTDLKSAVKAAAGDKTLSPDEFAKLDSKLQQRFVQLLQQDSYVLVDSRTSLGSRAAAAPELLGKAQQTVDSLLELGKKAKDLEHPPIRSAIVGAYLPALRNSLTEALKATKGEQAEKIKTVRDEVDKLADKFGAMSVKKFLAQIENGLAKKVKALQLQP